MHVQKLKVAVICCIALFMSAQVTADTSPTYRDVREKFMNKMDAQWTLINTSEKNFQAQAKAVASMENTLSDLEAASTADDRAAHITLDLVARFEVALEPVFEAFKARGEAALEHCQRIHEGIDFLKMRSPAGDEEFAEDEDIFTKKVVSSLCPTNN